MRGVSPSSGVFLRTYFQLRAVVMECRRIITLGEMIQNSDRMTCEPQVYVRFIYQSFLLLLGSVKPTLSHTCICISLFKLSWDSGTCVGQKHVMTHQVKQGNRDSLYSLPACIKKHKYRTDIRHLDGGGVYLAKHLVTDQMTPMKLESFNFLGLLFYVFLSTLGRSTTRRL